MERVELTVPETHEDPRRLAAAVGANLRDELSRRRDRLHIGDRADFAVRVSPAATADEIATAVADRLVAAPEEAT